MAQAHLCAMSCMVARIWLVSLVTPVVFFNAVWVYPSMRVSLFCMVARWVAKTGMVEVAEVLFVHQRMVARIMLMELVSRCCIFYLVFTTDYTDFTQIKFVGDWVCGEGREIFFDVKIIFGFVIIIFSFVDVYFVFVDIYFYCVVYNFSNVLVYFSY